MLEVDLRHLLKAYLDVRTVREKQVSGIVLNLYLEQPEAQFLLIWGRLGESG